MQRNNRNVQRLRRQRPFIFATGTPGQSWKNIVLQSSQTLADCWTNSMWHPMQKSKKAHPQHTNVDLSPQANTRTHTHTQSLKTRRASSLLTEPLGTLQEHRGEEATDLLFSVTSQRSPGLLPFHKQTKDRRAGCGKWKQWRGPTSRATEKQT